MKLRKRYLAIALAIACVIVAIKCIDNFTDTRAVANESTRAKNCEDWNSIMADQANASQILLGVDGTENTLANDRLYMDENFNPMIDIRLLTGYFSCAVITNNDTVTLQKFNNEVVLTIGSSEAVVDGLVYELEAAVTRQDDIVYVPLKSIGDFLSYDYSWDAANNRIALNNRKPDEKIYPYSYDYRNYQRVPAVKDQAEGGTCWAFASMTALESALRPGSTLDFAEDHMVNKNGYNLSESDGGEYNIAMAYLASWTGPVNEADDPYGDGSSPEGLTAVMHVQEMQIIDSKALDEIKKYVFLYGGVQSSLYMSVRDEQGASTENYSPETSAYCYIGTEKPNHDIVIVGWDDAYSADNFTTEVSGDGAFICVNSWGSEFGEDGFFYVSYYDSNIGIHNICYTRIDSADNYDNLYQTDLCGWVGQMGYGREYAYFANVYEAESDEELKAVGFYSTGANTSYEVYFVDGYEAMDSFQDKTLVASGTLSKAGYYTIDVDDGYVLLKGQRYAVVVYVNTEGSVHPVAIEYASDEYTSTVDTTDGEGYISFNGNSWEHVEETQNCDICLKMYTDDIKE